MSGFRLVSEIDAGNGVGRTFLSTRSELIPYQATTAKGELKKNPICSQWKMKMLKYYSK